MSLEVLGQRPLRSGPERTLPKRARPVSDRRWVIGVGAAALVAVAAWVPFRDTPLSPDEGGFLLLARQWHPGSSLYGDYWVDRPPMLLWLFALAAHLGPVGHSPAGVIAPGVKLLGGLASGATVTISGALGRLVAPARRWTPPVTVVAAAALLSSPLLGMPETNGEVLALPFVLLGIVFLIAAERRSRPRDGVLLTAAAGASAACAALVKQNVVDVFVFGAVLLLGSRGEVSLRVRRACTFLATATGVLAATVLGAAARGTSPSGLWAAVVVFRLQATAVIRASASAATSERLSHLATAAVGSGVAALWVVAAVGALHTRVRQAAPDDPARALAWAASAMALWELWAVAVGGSYWLHYLTGLVPGVLLLMALVRPSRRWKACLTACTAYVVVATAVVWGRHAITRSPVSDDARVAAYLRARAERSDEVVVAFGHPDIVLDAGMASPYEYLWSLPVRVRDPRLALLGDVLTGPDAPRWVVVAGDSLGSWGLDPSSTQRILARRYVDHVTYGDWQVWRHR